MDPLDIYKHLVGNKGNTEAPKAGEPPLYPIEYWEKKISYRVFVDGDVSLGEFCSLLRECWADAYAKGVRDAKRIPKD